MTLTYQEFLAEKINFEQSYGFDVPADQLAPVLLPHQRHITQWAIAGGRRALFEKFGLGKSVQQLEILNQILKAEGGRCLIVCPLGVRGEFVNDARDLLGIEITFVRRSEEVDHGGIYITNYESVREGKLDPNLFVAVSLDEAAVLRSYGSKTFQTFLTLFDGVKYRFVATATPSPNRYKELIHYAGFLGIMDTGQALTRFFQRDSTKANHLTLYPHKEAEFYLWLNSWAVFLQAPSDLGYSDEGFVLPPLDVVWHEVSVDHSQAGVERDGQHRMFKNAALGVQDSAREKRDTLPQRLAQLMRLIDTMVVGGPERLDDQVVIWCDLNMEQDAIEESLTARGLTFSSVHGALDVDEVERRIASWRNRETYALIGKPVMLGQGLNLQQSNKAIFIGVTYKFNDTIQACHRIQRYGQTRPCEAHFIYAESEREVVATLQEKWQQHDELTGQMSHVIREHGLDQTSITTALSRSMGVERREEAGRGWMAVNNDCVVETMAMETASVDLVITSIPFSNHYEYTPSYNDFGHTDDNDHFWAQMDYLTPELLRVLQPGRLYCCHVKDRILFGNTTDMGYSTVSPFHAEGIMHGRRHGFDYLGMITVVTDVVRENNQSYRLGWFEQCKDGSRMGVGSPEYILLFRKPQSDRTQGYGDVKVEKSKDEYTRARWQVDAHAFWRSSGNRLLTPDDLDGLSPAQRSRLFEEWSRTSTYDYASHIELGEALDAKKALSSKYMMLAPASPDPDVWHDVTRMLTLNTAQAAGGAMKHVCPLQFDIVDRLITRYSNPGDLVYDPFGGLMTVPVRALKAGRRGRGVELNTEYFGDGVRYLRSMEMEISAPSLFDLIEMEGVAS